MNKHYWPFSLINEDCGNGGNVVPLQRKALSFNDNMKKLLFLTLCLMPVGPLCAEELTDTSRVVSLDEIVVVYQPKEQAPLRLQPVSSSLFSEQEIDALKVHDLSELSQYVPSFAMPGYGSRLTSSMYMRGIGSRINNPAVGIYADNIPLMSKAAFNNHFYMLDRVDILRGPQGTLYGQNTEGGLVRLYSKNPMTYQGTDIHLSIGKGLWRNVEVAHHHRVSEQLAFSIAGFYSGLTGFINNQNFTEKNDKTNEAGAKTRLVWAPSQKLKLDWTADYQWVKQNGFGYGEAQLSTTDTRLTTPSDPATTIMNNYRRSMLNTGLSIGYEMEHLLFTSTTSYQFLDDRMNMDQDYMTPDYLRLEQRQRMNAVTQELVLRSRDQRRWQHTSGLFGSYQWLRTEAPVYFGTDMRAMLAETILGYMPERVQSMFTTWEIPVLDVSESFHTPQMSLGLYHESNILLTDRLKATLGFRLNYDHVKIDYDTQALMMLHYAAQMGPRTIEYTNGLLSPLAQSHSKGFVQFLPKVGLTYNFDDNIGNIYALVSKGYRSGGYNIQMFSDILQSDLMANGKDISSLQNETKTLEHTAEDYAAIEKAIAYKPEESWNYEAGTHLNLFDSKLHFDLAIFFMQIRNQQLSVMEPNSNYGRIMVNAGKSHSCGLETTLRGRLFEDAFDWAVTYSFTNAKFDEYDAYKDKYVPFVPRHSFTTVLNYRLGHFTFGANVTGQGKIWWDEANTFAQKFYALLGAHVDYTVGPAVISLWGRNLTNTKYNTFAIQSSAAGGPRYFAQRANPIQVGLDVNLHF